MLNHRGLHRLLSYYIYDEHNAFMKDLCIIMIERLLRNHVFMYFEYIATLVVYTISDNHSIYTQISKLKKIDFL